MQDLLKHWCEQVNLVLMVMLVCWPGVLDFVLLPPVMVSYHLVSVDIYLSGAGGPFAVVERNFLEN